MTPSDIKVLWTTGNVLPLGSESRPSDVFVFCFLPFLSVLPRWLFVFSLLELFINLYITALYNSGHRTTSQNFQFLYIFCKVDLYIAVTLYITVTFPRVAVVHRFDFTTDNDIRLKIPSLWRRKSTKYLKCTRYISIV